MVGGVTVVGVSVVTVEPPEPDEVLELPVPVVEPVPDPLGVRVVGSAPGIIA